MPNRTRPIRPGLPAPSRSRRTGPRPWPSLPPQVQAQLAQRIARLLRLPHPSEGEARHADRPR